jgi:hypothetical protein
LLREAKPKAVSVAGFFLAQHTKTGKDVPNDEKYTEGHKMYQMAVKYTKLPHNIPTLSQNLPQVGFMV